jgi:hypothetical protein
MEQLLRTVVHFDIKIESHLRFGNRAANRRFQHLKFEPVYVQGADTYAFTEKGQGIFSELAQGDFLRGRFETVGCPRDYAYGE